MSWEKGVLKSPNLLRNMVVKVQCSDARLSGGVMVFMAAVVTLYAVLNKIIRLCWRTGIRSTGGDTIVQNY